MSIRAFIAKVRLNVEAVMKQLASSCAQRRDISSLNRHGYQAAIEPAIASHAFTTCSVHSHKEMFVESTGGIRAFLKCHCVELESHLRSCA